MIRVLMVYNNERASLLSLHTLLILDGYNVSKAHDSTELIQALRDTPHLMILDLSAPFGPEIAQILKKSPKFCSIPMILLGECDHFVPCDACVHNPIDPEQVMKKVWQLCAPSPDPQWPSLFEKETFFLRRTTELSQEWGSHEWG